MCIRDRVQAVVVVTNQEEPVVVRTVTTVVDVPQTVLLNLMVVAAAKVSTANTSEVVMVTNVVSKTLKPLTVEEEVPVTSVAKAAAPMLEVDPVVQASAIPASVLLAQLALVRTVTVSTMDQTVHQVLVNLVTSLVAVKVEELTVVTVVSPSLGMVTPINLKSQNLPWLHKKRFHLVSRSKPDVKPSKKEESLQFQKVSSTSR